MSEPADNYAEEPEIDGELVAPEGELVAEARPLPVPADAQAARPLAVRRGASLPATVAAASGGLVLGIAAFMLLKVLRRPTAARSLARKRGRMLDRRRGVEVAGSRSFLVDIHLLKR